VVEGLESRPFVRTKYINEGGEVEACMVAYIFVLTGLRGVDVEIYNLRINVFSIFKCSYKWTDILEGCTSYKLRSWVL